MYPEDYELAAEHFVATQPRPRTLACYAMSMLEKRLQILVDESRLARVQAAAKARGESVGAFVRYAIDAVLVTPLPKRRTALRRIRSAPPMVAGDIKALRSERADRLNDLT